MRRFVTSSAIAEMSRTLTSLFAALTGAGRLLDLKGNLEQDRRPAAAPALLLDVREPARHALGLAGHCSRWASGTHRTVARTTSGRHTDGGQRTSLAK